MTMLNLCRYAQLVGVYLGSGTCMLDDLISVSFVEASA